MVEYENKQTITEQELKDMYPSAYEEMKKEPIRYLWDSMENDRKIEVLKGITQNKILKEERK